MKWIEERIVDRIKQSRNWSERDGGARETGKNIERESILERIFLSLLFLVEHHRQRLEAQRHRAVMEREQVVPRRPQPPRAGPRLRRVRRRECEARADVGEAAREARRRAAEDGVEGR